MTKKEIRKSDGKRVRINYPGSTYHNMDGWVALQSRGSNVGFSFLQTCLEKAGYKIVKQ